MKKFLVIYHSTPDAVALSSNLTPKQQEEEMKLWMSWKETMGQNLVDFGTPLMSGIRLFPDGNSEGSAKEVTGYSMIRAKDMDEAKSLLYNHPCFKSKSGCDVELHECVLMY